MLKNHAVSVTLPVYAGLCYWGVLVLSGCLFKSEIGDGTRKFIIIGVARRRVAGAAAWARTSAERAGDHTMTIAARSGLGL